MIRHLTKTALLILALGALLTCAHAQQRAASNLTPLITKVRVDTSQYYFGPLYATISGRERKIADEAINAWIIEGGRRVVYSGRDGSGGFENEGESLRIYDPRTGQRRKIMSEYFAVTDVKAVTTSENRTALLVEMGDGGLGASYFAVVDPERGEVFFRRWAKILSRQGDVIVIGHYTEQEWERYNEDRHARLTPYKTERQNLNTLLRRRVIVNRRIG